MPVRATERACLPDLARGPRTGAFVRFGARSRAWARRWAVGPMAVGWGGGDQSACPWRDTRRPDPDAGRRDHWVEPASKTTRVRLPLVRITGQLRCGWNAATLACDSCPKKIAVTREARSRCARPPSLARGRCPRPRRTWAAVDASPWSPELLGVHVVVDGAGDPLSIARSDLGSRPPPSAPTSAPARHRGRWRLMI